MLATHAVANQRGGQTCSGRAHGSPRKKRGAGEGDGKGDQSPHLKVVGDFVEAASVVGTMDIDAP